MESVLENKLNSMRREGWRVGITMLLIKIIANNELKNDKYKNEGLEI